ncbi:MAG: T9SS type A sorting domain-containing protein [Candidatus Marinimicrobia bacterium]|nr:T9SS type A sorting domain-containing protein [Candidatus Neomarinimicrobiota bacterium]
MLLKGEIMLKINNLVVLLLILLCGNQIFADEIRPTDDINAIRDAIVNANDGDVIILEKGKIYYSQATIDVNANITIKADEATEGPKPIVSSLIKEDGTTDREMMFVRSDLTCIGVHFHGGISGRDIHDDIRRGIVWVDTENMRAIFDNCIFEDFDSRTLQLEAPNMRFFATNCLWLDDFKYPGPSEGRSFDLRQFGPDTLSIQNSTFVNAGNRWIRHMPSSGRLDPIGYCKIDHCTFLNGSGYHPVFDFGHIIELQFTNNVVSNPGIMGSDFMRRPSENGGQFLIADPADYYAEDKALRPYRVSEVFYDRSDGIVVLGCHGIDSMGTEITMSHNNFYMDQAIADKIATNDTLHVAKWWCSQFRNSIVGDTSQAFANEELNFTMAPDPMVDAIMDAYVGYWDKNQYFIMDYTNPDSLDLNYGTSANAYTAAVGGFPLGDLNWYPEKKAEWEEGGSAVEFYVEAESGTIGAEWSVYDDDLAMGGQYIVSDTTGVGDSDDKDSPDLLASYTFNAEAGDYNFWVRLRHPGGDTDDSFFYRVNGGEWVKWNQVADDLADDVFHWDLDNDDVTLVSGTNTFDVCMREDGAEIDVFYFTNTGSEPEAGPTAIDNNDETTIESFELSQNYPNPFNPTTNIRYSIQKPGRVRLTVYNMVGQAVATLVDNQKQAGIYSVTFDASHLASSVYYYSLESGNQKITKKMLFMK